MQTVGDNRDILHELIECHTAVIVIGLKCLEGRSNSHMSLGVTTTEDDCRVIKHELNLVSSVISSVTRQSDLKTSNGLNLHLGIKLVGFCIQSGGCLSSVSHEPSTVQSLIDIGLACKTKCEIQTRRHDIIVRRLTKYITDFRNVLRDCQ